MQTLTENEILQELEHHGGTFPRQALEQAIAQKEQIIPRLLQNLEWARDNIEFVYNNEDYMAHLYAMYLLAQFRETRAYPLIVDLVSVPGEVVEHIMEDTLTEDLHRILASVCGGDISLIQQLAENEEANEYVRSAAVDTLVCLVAAGDLSREEVIAYFRALFNHASSQESIFWGSLVIACTYLGAKELNAEVRQAFANGLIDPFLMDLKYAEERLVQSPEKALGELRQNRHYTLIGNAIKEMEWWAAFEPASQPQPIPKQPSGKQAKVGRNDPCPCGSGKKYKKCCGAPV